MQQPTKKFTKQAPPLEAHLFGKVQPNALELECAILGALLLDREAVPQVRSILRVSDFYDPRHAAIYQAICDVYDQNAPVDIITAAQQLRKNDQLEVVGGGAYLVDITNKIASAANVEYHSRLLWELGTRRLGIQAARECEKSLYDDTQDVFKVYDKIEHALGAARGLLSIKKASDAPQLFGAGYMRRLESRGAVQIADLVGTGIADFDEKCPFVEGDLICIAGRPGMGKSALIATIARNMAKCGKKGRIYTLEMTETQFVDRIASQEANIKLSTIKSGKLSDAEWQQLSSALEGLGQCPLTIDDNAAVTVQYVTATARMQKKQHGLDYILIDYLQLMDFGTLKGINRDQQIGEATRALKGLAKELGIPVIFLSQLSRAVETRGGSKRPQLSDLRESGNVEQDCDKIIFIYRPEYYGILEDEDGMTTHGVAELIVAKYRDGSPFTGKVAFRGDYTMFAQLDDWDNNYGANSPAPPTHNHPQTVSETAAFAALKPNRNMEDVPF